MSAAQWSWDLDRIHAKGYTDNVVDLMVGKLNPPAARTQTALQQLACLGNIAADRDAFPDPREIGRGRRCGSLGGGSSGAGRAPGGLLPVRPRSRPGSRLFVDPGGAARRGAPSDRQAACGATSLREKRDEAIFDIVNQLNRGAALITSRDEREQLAELNLMAGKRAKTSTAYASALTYLLAGAALLAEDCWERQHALAFSLELHRAECEFLSGALTPAEARLGALSTRAATTIQQAAVSCLRMDLYTILGQSGRAIAVGLDYLRRVGIDWSPHPTDEDVRREYERIWALLGGRTDRGAH